MHLAGGRVSAGICLVMIACAPQVHGELRYVDQSATTGANDGSSWDDAYLELRDALAAAAVTPAITELWVAAGVYTPTSGPSQLSTFQLRDGFVVRGGFAGGETSITQRDPAQHVTVLSGDINTPGVFSDNCHHVLFFSNQDATTILETCVITDGNALPGAFVSRGGGALITGLTTSPTLINCRFVGNFAADDAGAVYIEEGAPAFVNCTFVGNSAGGDGGAVRSTRGAVRFTNCTFAGNTAGGAGGAYFTTEHEGNNCFANPVFDNCIFRDNSDSGPQDQSAQFDFDTFLCPPERTAGSSARAPTDPIAINFSFLQDWDGSFGGLTNSSADPLLADIDGIDDILGTIDDDVRLTENSLAIDFGDDGALPADSADLDDDGNFAEATPRDADLRPRVNSLAVDAGAFEFPFDCNNNGVLDALDISGGTSADCNANTIPDECDADADCDSNGVLDVCEWAAGTAQDCNSNGTLDLCDILDQVTDDCDSNGIPDVCDLAVGDCNANGSVDACDIAGGTSIDCNLNGTPDECEPGGSDCNFNGVDDSCDLVGGTSADCNGGGVPDECELAGNDCNSNGIPDECDRDCDTNGVPDVCEAFLDCNSNGESDTCDIVFGGRPDFNRNGIPDECDLDCNENGYPDFIDIAFNLSDDCNDDDIPDECQLAGNDCNSNGIPDDCDGLLPGDADGDGDVDAADHDDLVLCITGPLCDPTFCPTPQYAGNCCGADVDGDGDVDLRDFAAFERLLP